MPRIVEALKRIFAAQQEVGVAELINGPYLGYFLAAYSVPVVDGFVAYAKVFARRPGNPWEGLAIAKYTAHGVLSAAALRSAQARAVNAIGNWQVAFDGPSQSARSKSNG